MRFFDDALAKAVERHAETYPNNVLSVIYSDNGTQALIKVDDGVDWSGFNGLTQSSYNRSSHKDLVDILAGPQWSNQRIETE